MSGFALTSNADPKIKEEYTMKQNIYIAALLAGMLALAGCGGGNSSTEPKKDPPADPKDQQIADLQKERDDLKKERDDLQQDVDDAATEAALADAMSLKDALDKPLTGENDRYADLTDTSRPYVTGSGLSKTDAAVSPLMGWTGAQYTESADGKVVQEAHVYTKVGKGTEGKPFNVQYTLAEGVLASDSIMSSLVAIPSADQDAGYEQYKFDSGRTQRSIPGSYHGVSGHFVCSVVSNTGTCAVNKGKDGLELGHVLNNVFTKVGNFATTTWTFVPSSPSAVVTDGKGANLASYGWWLNKSADDWTVEVFAGTYGGGGTIAVAATIADTVSGTATYEGGAAGKYALTSSTGGTNAAGHFTADATLTATFGAMDKFKGTIDNFKDGEGNSIDGKWSVDLMESTIGSGSAIPPADTAWKMDGKGTKSGKWNGAIWATGDDGLPGVVTGTFNAHLGSEGRMAGAFGADKQ